MAILTATATSIAIPALLGPALPICYTIYSVETSHQLKEIKPSYCRSHLPLRAKFRPFDSKRSIGPNSRRSYANLICMAALNAKCGAVQTLPRVRRRKTITTTPIKGDMKAPKVDSRGPAFPPRDGGGGGGGGGGGFGGGFFLFGLLVFLAFLKDKEQEPDYHEYRSSAKKRLRY